MKISQITSQWISQDKAFPKKSVGDDVFFDKTSAMNIVPDAVRQASSSEEINAKNQPAGNVKSIVAKYNLRSIYYTDLKAMTEELLSTGALRKDQYLDFLPPSEEFAMIDGTRNANWNQPQDYIGKLEDQIDFSRKHTPYLSTKHLEYQLNLKKQFLQN